MASATLPWSMSAKTLFVDVNPSRKRSAMVALDSLPLGPKSQVMGNTSKADLARQKLSARTATDSSSTRTTALIPRRDEIFDASKLTNLPPNTGQALMAAYCMPGKTVSIPYLSEPLTLGAVSKRLGDLPNIFQSLGCLRVMDFGSGAGNLDAWLASFP